MRWLQEQAEPIVAPGGPSAPAWAFFTALLVGVLGIIVELIRSRHSRDNGTKALQDSIETLVQAVDGVQRSQNEHLQWHLEQEARKHGSYDESEGLGSSSGHFDYRTQRRTE